MAGRKVASSRKKVVRVAPDVRRELLLQAARKCLSQKGLRGFTVQNIANEADVSLGLIGHYFEGIDDLLQAVFKSVMFELPELGADEAGDLKSALANLREVVEKNFATDYYSRENMLVWLPLFEEMLLNAKMRRRLDAQEQKYIDGVAYHIAKVAEFRKLNVDAQELAYNFLSLLDGLWLRWCLSERVTVSREKATAIRYLEAELGPLG